MGHLILGIVLIWHSQSQLEKQCDTLDYIPESFKVRCSQSYLEVKG